MLKSYKQIIILRKDLNMRKGKMIAQGAHASLGAILSLSKISDTEMVIPRDERAWSWLTGKFKKIAVSVNSEKELLDLSEAAKSAGFITALILDSGLTEFNGVPTYTALAIGPDEESKLDSITGHLPLL